ncbi:4Fe-4S binding protein [Butyrivibrio sp. INlla14]|uniref:4Fe-4S binding protein n=1 Tax=Butyrivibrio sp. INlla14 TaxID=1520808 RepID=UPI000876A2AC|nr:4Fe-4S binding protein [Butyrivibrio sp. INlla14]SCY73100.1 4Fe-4S dicluster domain-containing protein [Butyrivibrio sp. INlla14]
MTNRIDIFKRKEDCCGCSACYAICPKGAITMLADEEGFEYPIIDTNLCIGCRKCINVCPIRSICK